MNYRTLLYSSDTTV